MAELTTSLRDLAHPYYFKFLGPDGTPAHGGNGAWALPNGKLGNWRSVPGNWRSVRGTLEPCENGLHLCRPTDLLDWCAPTLWVAETATPLKRVVTADDKVVVRKARLIRRVQTWNDRTARLFACDCADRALALTKSPDPRSVAAVVCARGYANGRRTRAALDAARAAAWDAARDAARAAARDAARDAAWAAAWDAARAAARDAARAAARDAARDAAWAAARDAARDAARAAALAAGWDAAWAAERDWQLTRLFQYLDGEVE